MRIRWMIFMYLLIGVFPFNTLVKSSRLSPFLHTMPSYNLRAGVHEMPDTLDTMLPGPADFFVPVEDSLKRLALEMVLPVEDSVRLARNDLFRDYLFDVLREPGSMQYPFDSLKTVSMLMPPDSIFRIVTWYVPLSGQQFRYFGCVQLANPSQEKTGIYVLHEELVYDGDASSQPFSHDRWYGSLYYDLITNESGGNKYYVLLGWRGDNPLTRKRLIEPFIMHEKGIVFGDRVFKMEGHDPYRVIFEYSSRATMGLLFDRQYLHQGNNERLPMIVFDRLAPIDESFQGEWQHYVPEGNIFDAFLFSDGFWEMHLDVDARSIPGKNSK